MGNKDSKPKDIKQLCKETKMNQKEITAFYKDFKKAHPDGTVTKAEFKTIYSQQFPHGDSDAFADNIFTQFDKDGDQKLDFREFITAVGLSEKGTPAQQLTWAFNMYDLDGSGEITMRECHYMIKSVLRCYTSGGDLDNQSRELTERIFANIDKNRDGKLSQKEFVEGANKDRTLLTMLEGKPLMVA